MPAVPQPSPSSPASDMPQVGSLGDPELDALLAQLVAGMAELEAAKSGQPAPQAAPQPQMPKADISSLMRPAPLRGA